MTQSQNQQCLLTEEPNHALKAEIVAVLWKVNTSGQTVDQGNVQFLQYFREYVQEEILAIHLGVVNAASGMAATTYLHIIGIVKLLWEHKKNTRSEICQKLKDTLFLNDDLNKIGHAVDFALRLWLLINVRGLEVECFIPGRGQTIYWENTSSLTLESFVSKQFPLDDHLSEEALNTPLTQLQHKFTAFDLHHIGGFQIVWTRNIEDHLSIKGSHPRVLNIFPYKSCIEALEKCEGPIPKDVLNDTLRSLDILFPSWDANTNAFLKREGYPALGQGLYPKGVVRVKDFAVWKRRLFDLSTEYNTAPPVNLLADRRNRLQFWNFCFGMAVVAFTVTFGIISIVTACISTHYARLTYQLARDAANSPPCFSTCPIQASTMATNPPQIQYLIPQELQA